MWCDVIDLSDFYKNVLGKTTKALISNCIRGVWPNVSNQRVLGLGYAIPFLDIFQNEAERTIAVMPARQGVLHWPGEESGRVILCDEEEIPLPDVSFDKILLVHALECSEQLRPMLREVWRILADGGRLVVVIPNRRGVWARLDHTPFGNGNSYTPAQAQRLLRDTLFMPIRTERALFIPPIRSRLIVASSRVWEEVGKRTFPSISGVLILEFRKQIHASTTDMVKSRSRRQHYKVIAGS